MLASNLRLERICNSIRPYSSSQSQILPKNLVFCFTGQGSQWVGMGKDIYRDWRVARDVFDEASELLKLNLCKLMFDGSESELLKTSISQPCIVVHSIACMRILRNELEYDPISKCDYLLGSSLGEISALEAGKSLSTNEAICFAKNRGLIFESCLSTYGPSSMVMLSPITESSSRVMCETIRSMDSNDLINVACVNSPDQVIISGLDSSVEKAVEIFKSGIFDMVSGPKKKKIFKLNTLGSFHSSLLEKSERQILEFLTNNVKVKKPSIPLLSNLIAEPVYTPEQIIDVITRLTSKTVLFSKCLQFLKSNYNEPPAFIEVGPKQLLTGAALENGYTTTLFMGSAKDINQNLKIIDSIMRNNQSKQNKL